IANVTTEQLLKVIRQKQEKMGGDLKKAFLQILGSCFSMGLTVDGKNPKDVQEEVTKGLYDKKLV
ncbi:MAG TPA: 50S ribosomal protein L11, partial [Candidatus Nanoarchaeia archaeon]|nr:50S ribosomal protein L11 [Candidatus Nanoarchaeia archaeon]